MTTAFNLEAHIADATAARGYRDDIPIDIGRLRTSAGLTLTGATDPAIATQPTGMVTVQFGVSSTAQLSFSFTMPWTFAEGTSDLKLVLSARKIDATADENTDLKLQAQAVWFTPGTASDRKASSTAPTLTAGDAATSTLTTAAMALLGTSTTATTAPGGFAEYELDIGARLIAEGKVIEAGDVVNITFGPNEAVGSSDMVLQIAPPLLRLRRHAVPQRPFNLD